MMRLLMMHMNRLLRPHCAALPQRSTWFFLSPQRVCTRGDDGDRNGDGIEHRRRIQRIVWPSVFPDSGKTVFRSLMCSRFCRRNPTCSRSIELEVLLVDQEERWRRDKALPLRIYLSAFSDIAANGELVRALVDGDRRERRRAAGRQGGATFGRPTAHRRPSPSPIRADPVHADTEFEQEPPRRRRTSDGSAARSFEQFPQHSRPRPLCRLPSNNSRSH